MNTQTQTQAETAPEDKGTVFYIFDPTNYKGSIENCLTKWSDGTETIHYVDPKMTFEEYKAMKGNQNLITMEWEQFYEEYYKPFNDSFTHNWSEISKDKFYDLFECLPPIMVSNGKELAFFISEPFTDRIHTFCAEHKGKYYSSLMYRNTPPSDLKQSLIDWLDGQKEVSQTQE